MWLMAAEVPIHLDVLNQSRECVWSVDVRLVSMDDSYALVSLEKSHGRPDDSRLCGAPVRYELEDGMRRYEVSGSIIAIRDEDEESSTDDDNFDIANWDLRIRIWECKLSVQRRAQPRRKFGFPVELREINGPDALAEPGPEAIVASCVDVGAGGMRVRTNRLAEVPTRMHLEFCLPTTKGPVGSGTSHRFSLAGRVIRADSQGGDGGDMDIAFCFEGLSVRDGMALHNLLT